MGSRRAVSYVTATLMLIVVTILSSFLIYDTVIETGTEGKQAGGLSVKRFKAPAGSALGFSGKNVKITINNPHPSEITNYAVKLELNTTVLPVSEWVLLSASNMFFTEDSLGRQPLYFYVEDFDPVANTSTVWVKVPRLPPGNSEIYMWYGGETNPYSSNNDPRKVFPLFDDFETGSLDTSLWNVVHYDGSGTASVTGGRLLVDSANSGYFWFASDGGSGAFAAVPLSDNYAAETHVITPGNQYERFFSLRASLSANSRHIAFLYDGGATHMTTMWRDSDGSSSAWAGENTGIATGGDTDMCLRISKNGNTYKTWVALDCKNWQVAYSKTGDYHGYVGVIDALYAGAGQHEWVRVRPFYDPEPHASSYASPQSRQLTLLTVYVVNAGGRTLELAQAYVYSYSDNTLIEAIPLNTTLEGKGATAEVPIVVQGDYTGNTLKVKIVAKGGYTQNLLVSVPIPEE